MHVPILLRSVNALQNEVITLGGLFYVFYRLSVIALSEGVLTVRCSIAEVACTAKINH